VILLRSSGGRICAYDFVEKSGRTDRRSIRMRGNGQVGELLGRRDYSSFSRVGPITATLSTWAINDGQRVKRALI
jgi:hypothetical protein